MRLPHAWNDSTGKNALRTVAASRAWVRSQSSPGGCLALTTCPTSALTKIPPHLFRVVLLRRFRLPLPLSPHTCGCGPPFDSGDLDLQVLNSTDSRRLEVVLDGLPLFGGSQLAEDTTLLCSLHSDGSLHNCGCDTDGEILPPARRRREWRYPELVGPGSRARLVVLVLEVSSDDLPHPHPGRSHRVLPANFGQSIFGQN